MNDQILASGNPATLPQEIIQMYSYRAEDDCDTLIMVTPFGAIAIWVFSISELGPDRYWLAACMAFVFSWGFCEWYYTSRIKKLEFGSYIDLRNKQIVGWQGKSPAARETVEIASISEIVLKTYDTGDLGGFSARNSNGVEIKLPICIAGDLRDWVADLHTHFPEITVRRESCGKAPPEDG
jgi:hypothetical protein